MLDFLIGAQGVPYITTGNPASNRLAFARKFASKPVDYNTTLVFPYVIYFMFVSNLYQVIKIPVVYSRSTLQSLKPHEILCMDT
jgi:hypothetical protein